MKEERKREPKCFPPNRAPDQTEAPNKVPAREHPRYNPSGQASHRCHCACRSSAKVQTKPRWHVWCIWRVGTVSVQQRNSLLNSSAHAQRSFLGTSACTLVFLSMLYTGTLLKKQNWKFWMLCFHVGKKLLDELGRTELDTKNSAKCIHQDREGKQQEISSLLTAAKQWISKNIFSKLFFF